MPYRYDPEKGEYVYEDPTQSTEPPVAVAYRDTYGASPAASISAAMAQQENAQFQQDKAQADVVTPDRQFIADSPGQAVSEVMKVLGNAGAGIITDYGDLIAGLGDVIVETADAVTPGGDGFTVDNIFNDADNPWTRARRDFFKPETEVGKQVGTLARVATALIALPKVAVRGIIFPFQALSKASVLGGVADRAGDVASFIGKADAYMKGLGQTDKAVDATKALGALEKSFVKGSPAARAAKNAAENDWLMLPLTDVAKATAGVSELKGYADWAENVQQSVRGLTQLGVKSSAASKIRTVGQALAWDAFVAFNVFGEGDDEMDATLSDAMYDMGLPVIPGLMTEAEDSAWARKSKQMVEGLAIGVAMNGLIDTYRTYKFAQQFKKAKPTEQAQIMKAFGLSAQEIGDSLGRQITSVGGDSLSGVRVGGKTAAPGDARLEAIDRMREADATAQAQAAAAPGRPAGGPLAMRQPMLSDLGRGLDEQRLALARQAEQGLTTAMRQGSLNQADALRGEVQQGMQGATLDSPVQQFLAVAEGRASAVNPDDLRYQQRLAQQLTDSGVEAPPGSITPDPLADAAPGAPRFNFDAMPPVEAAPAAPGGELLDPNYVRPVTVEDLGDARPRPPTPVVTPQTIQSAFAQEARQAWAQMETLTLTEGWDGVMRNIRVGAKRLMPSNRVDALEYARQFPVSMNGMGVIPASDSVWSNFISQKALAEGWARIDPDTLELYYNRKIAYELDRGDAVTKQAQALDDFEALNDYQEAPIDIAESYRADQQENPLPIDPQQTQKVAEGEADLAVAQQQTKAVEQGKATDAYDEWEANQGKRDTAMEAVKAADEVDALDAAEEVRLTAAEKMRLTGDEPPQQIVREMLGMNLDEAINAEVIKADTTRGWNVLDRNGEQLNESRFPTKRQADEFARKENERFKEQLTSRARQMLQDGEDVRVSFGVETQLDNMVTAKVTITAAQERAILGVMPELDQMLKSVIDPAKARTFDLTQQQLDGVASAIRQGMEGMKGPAARALRNLADKLDVQVKLLEPQARAQKAVDDLLANVEQFGKHGEFCDFL